jgi:glycosyltransferase involved in cell wall biosynthesis
MPSNFRIAVIVTTYNRPEALALVLDGFLAQSDRDFELLVADDGSTADTAELVNAYQTRAPFKLTHVWQEDIGFRAAAARNRALAQTDADYIVFTDGDCVPPTDFVAAQRELAEPGWFLSGNRVLLSETFTQQVVQTTTPIFQWGKACCAQ